MKKITKILSVAVLGIAAVACGSPEKMAKMAENVTVTCNPGVLEVKGGEINADVTVTYPEDYSIQRLSSRLHLLSFTKVAKWLWSRSCSRARR